MRLFIRFDVGGTHVKHGLFTEEGEVLVAEEYDTHYDRQLFLDSWQSVVAAIGSTIKSPVLPSVFPVTSTR